MSWLSAEEHGPRAARVLLVDDDPALLFGLARVLRRDGHEVMEASTCELALAQCASAPDVVLVDLRLPDGDGLELLGRLRARMPHVPIAVMTGHGSIDVAVRAVKAGAEEFLPKPFELAALRALVRRLAHGRLARGASRANRAPGELVARSDAARRLEDAVERLRNADCSLLVLGETGTGKSHLARRIHAVGARREGPFVDLNCAGLGRDLAESELFGHERGAFTGAQKTKVGLFEAAHGGTLFLDEIGDVDLQVQPKILKAIEEKRYRRVGDVRERAADVRLVAATHRDLATAIEEGRFRADLFYRIATVTLIVPALRDRREDIVPLARHLLATLAPAPVDLTRAAIAALEAHAWPGNIRELRNVLERGLILRRGEALDAGDLGLDRPAPPPLAAEAELHAEGTLRHIEREHIRRALDAEDGRVEAAARRLGMPRSTLYQKIKLYGLARPRARISRPAIRQTGTE